MPRARLLLALFGAALTFAGPASASGWLPHPSGATWTYRWSDSAYADVPTTEKVRVSVPGGPAFTLAWTSEDKSLGNPEQAVVGSGTLQFRDTPAGIVNTDWSSTAPPASFPILCADASGCSNSLASTYYNVIWGSSAPTLAEPLTKGLTWTSRGGSLNDVRSSNSFVGLEQVTVPAFSTPVTAAKVSSQITQRGAQGDPFGSGTRTVWWVWGVGPVKVVFQHAGGNAAVTSAVLTATNLAAKPPPSLDVYFPLVKGTTATYRWTNSRHLEKPMVERLTITGTSNGAARFSVATVSGPIQVQGTYWYALSADGLANVSATTRSASLSKLPKLGPRALPPGKRRRFVTPFDLLDFGLNPIFPAYPQKGDTWAATRSGDDFQVYGVTGRAKVLGFQTVSVPAGRFRALAVQSTLTQAGFPFGSGTRTSWFAPGRGLVKLVFRHRDGSVSVVTRLKSAR